MTCVRCEVTRAQLKARWLLGWGYDGRYIAASLSNSLPGTYYVRYEGITGVIMREAEKGGQAFEIAQFNRPIDKL